MLTIRPLEPSSIFQTLNIYAPLIFPPLLSRFQASSPSSWMAFEASLTQEIVGLALVEYYPHNQMAQLYSLVVKPEKRLQGIGKALFAFLQNYLIKKQVEALGFEYETSLPDAPALEKIVIAQGWPPPSLYLARYFFDGQAFNPSWIQRSYSLPSSMTLFPWRQLTSQERERLLFMENQGQFLPYLSPLREEKLIDPLSSFGLRYHQELIGWSITHRLTPDTLRYTSLYVDRDFHYTSYGIQLLIASIHSQKAQDIPQAIFEINLEGMDRSWLQFVKRRLKPLAYKTEKMKWAMQIFFL